MKNRYIDEKKTKNINRKINERETNERKNTKENH